MATTRRRPASTTKSTGKPGFIEQLSVTSDPAEDNFMVYGDSGIGKTVLAGSDPGALLIASDKGTMSAARRGAKCEVAKMKGWDDFVELMNWLSAGGCKEYTWVSVDGLTMLWEIAMVYTLAKERAENPQRSEYIPSKGDHQTVHMMMKRNVERLVAMPVRTLFTALPMNVETEDGDEIVIPQIRGQKGDVSNYICGLMSAFGRMTVEEDGSRRITWQADPPYTGKDRYDGLFSPYTDNITLTEIAERIESPVAPKRTATGTRRRRGTSTSTTTRRRRTQ